MKYEHKKLGLKEHNNLFVGISKDKNRFEISRIKNPDGKDIGILVSKNMKSEEGVWSEDRIKTLAFIEDDNGAVYSCVRNNKERFRIRICFPNNIPFVFKPDAATLGMQQRTHVDDAAPVRMALSLPTGNMMYAYITDYVSIEAKSCRTMIVTILDHQTGIESKIGEFTVEQNGNLCVQTFGQEMALRF